MVRRARAGDGEARNHLLEAFYTLALQECRRRGREKGLDRSDAESEAFFAITEAIYGFDLRRRRTRFGAYVAQRARGAVTWAARREAINAGRIVRKVRHNPKPKPPRKAQLREWCIGEAAELIRHKHGGRFLEWQRALPRRHDRLIASWLWWRSAPMSQAEIAKKLKISRSAVCQRRDLLLSAILTQQEISMSDQQLAEAVLNKPSFRRYTYDYDWWP